jgi:rubrerythrin
MSADSGDFNELAASLDSIPKLGVEEMRLMFRLENAGETFYNLLADRLGNAQAADLLRRNAREERGHAERLRRAIALKLGRAWEPEARDLAPFAIALPDAVTGELLAGIVQGELQGDAGYQKWADAEENAEVQKLLRQNGREETIHAGRVKEAIALLGG